jgi:hypothetical protein
MMDPSRRLAFAGTDAEAYTSSPGAWLPKGRRTSGISVAVFALRPQKSGRPIVTTSLPESAMGKELRSVAVFTWQSWDRVRVRPYFKLSYLALQKVFGELKGGPARPRR